MFSPHLKDLKISVWFGWNWQGGLDGTGTTCCVLRQQIPGRLSFLGRSWRSCSLSQGWEEEEEVDG